MKAKLTFNLNDPTDAKREKMMAALKAAMEGDLEPAREMGAELQVIPDWMPEDT